MKPRQDATRTSAGLTVRWTEAELFAAGSKRLNSLASQAGGSAKLRTAAKALSRLSISARRTVILELPKDVVAGLVTGSLRRTGGVVRDSDGKIVLHLKDLPSLKKAMKGIALPLMLLELAESALLNRKLDQIQRQVSALVEKVEAAQKATLLLPFEKAAKLAYLHSPASRQREIADTQAAIDEGVALSRQRLLAASVRLDPLSQEFENSNLKKKRLRRRTQLKSSTCSPRQCARRK